MSTTSTCSCGALITPHNHRGLSCVDVNIQVKDTLILDNVTLNFPIGSATAILSAPGAGVSSLLSFLAGHESAGFQIKSRGTNTNVSGAVGHLAQHSGAVGHLAQHDAHENLLTTREILELVYVLSRGMVKEGAGLEQLRSEGAVADGTSGDHTNVGGGEQPTGERNAVADDSTHPSREVVMNSGCPHCLSLSVDETLSLLGLVECADVRAGKLSGGQRRRLSLAEILVMPAGSCRGSVLLLDCPVAGVDSLVAFNITRALIARARASGGTFVASLKAPEPELFALFDNVLLIADGKVLFLGPVSDAEAFCINVLGPRDDSAWRPTVDYLSIAASSLRANEIADSWKASERCESVRASALLGLADVEVGLVVPAASEILSPHRADVSEDDVVVPVISFPHRRNRFFLLMQLHAKRAYRNVTFVRARVISALIMGAILGWMSSSAATIQPTDAWRIGVFLFSAVFVAFGNQSELPSLCDSRAVIYRHSTARLYSEFEWAHSYSLVSIPLALIVIFLFSVLVYYPGRFYAPLAGFQHFLVWILILFLFDRAVLSSMRCGTALWYLPSTAQSLNVLFIDFMLLWSGYYILRLVMPAYLSWACFISPAFWTMQGLTVNGVSSDIVASYGYLVSPMGLWGGVIFLFVWSVVFTFALPVILARKRHQGIVAPRGAARSHEQAPTTVVTPASCTPISLSFHDVCYDVICADSSLKRLLDNISADLKPGTITALLGASGSGKTTLLNVLAHRLGRGEGHITGSFKINDVDIEYDALKAVASFAQQFDSHFPMDTVHEALRFAANLRGLLGSEEAAKRADAATASARFAGK